MILDVNSKHTDIILELEHCSKRAHATVGCMHVYSCHVIIGTAFIIQTRRGMALAESAYSAYIQAALCSKQQHNVYQSS